MTHRLPNGGKGVRFWIFARRQPGSAQVAAPGLDLRKIFPNPVTRLATGIQSVKKGTQSDPVCRPSLQGARRREGSHASLHLPRSVRWKPWGRFAGRSPRWRASNRARSPATSTKPTACPRRRSSERCVKQHKPRTLPGSNLSRALVAVAVVSARRIVESPRRAHQTTRRPRGRRMGSPPSQP